MKTIQNMHIFIPARFLFEQTYTKSFHLCLTSAVGWFKVQTAPHNSLAKNFPWFSTIWSRIKLKFLTGPSRCESLSPAILPLPGGPPFLQAQSNLRAFAVAVPSAWNSLPSMCPVTAVLHHLDCMFHITSWLHLSNFCLLVYWQSLPTTSIWAP